MSAHWAPACIMQAPLFAVLKEACCSAWQTKTDWPAVQDYNQHLLTLNKAIVNHNKQPIQFIQQKQKSHAFIYRYEPSIYLRGEVLTRPDNWHDFFNMLVWLSFPGIKAALNYWQYNLLKQRQPADTQRTPIENKLTHLDENGMIVISSNRQLIDLLKEQAWHELFWQRRDAVKTAMQFFIIGHALYEKALKPYIGMTGSALVFEVAPDFFAGSLPHKIDSVDKLVSAWLYTKDNLDALTRLTPVPVLGVPGWWAANEMRAFYDNKDYFRAKREPGK